MSLQNFQEDRIQLIDEIFDLFDSENLGYVEIKDSLKILASMGKKLDIEEENDFLSIIDEEAFKGSKSLKEDENDFLGLVDPNNTGRVTKDSFIKAVEEMFTIPKDFLQEVEDAFKFFDRKGEGKVSCKELKNLLVRNSKEYKEESIIQNFRT